MTVCSLVPRPEEGGEKDLISTCAYRGFMTSCNVHTVIRDFEDVTNLIVVDTVCAI